MVVAITRGNLLKNIVMGLVSTGTILYAGTITAPVLTSLAQSIGLDIATDGTMISSFAATSLQLSFLVYEAFITNPIIFVPLLIVVFAAIWVLVEKRNKKKAAAAAE